jgi:hypothetical protein
VEFEALIQVSTYVIVFALRCHAIWLINVSVSDDLAVSMCRLKVPTNLAARRLFSEDTGLNLEI